MQEVVAGNGVLRTLRDQDYGFTENGVICVNIERIWYETENENRFIIEFAKTYAHELLHILLGIFDLPDLEEEEVIRAMVGEKWNNKIAALYGAG